MASNSIINIRNLAVFNGETNYRKIILKAISIAMVNTGNFTSVLRVCKNCVIGGAPIWATLEAGVSIIETDTAGTISGGRNIYTVALATDDSKIITSLGDIHMGPGETISLEITPNGGTLDCELGLEFDEDL